MSTQGITGVRSALNDDVWQKFCALPTADTQVLNEPQLRLDIEEIIADSWLLHTVTRKLRWKPLMNRFADAESASKKWEAARGRLEAAMRNQEAGLKTLTDQLSKAEHKRDSSLEKLKKTASSFLEHIEPEERNRVSTAVFSALADGFGKKSHDLKRAADFLFIDENEERRKLVRAIAGKGPLEIEDVARRVKRDEREVERNVRALLEADILEETPDGLVVFEGALAPWTPST
jgi:CRISPR/Cas system-associated endonuclease Cas1